MIESFIKGSVIFSSIFAFSFLVLTCIDVTEEERVTASKKKIIKFMSDNRIKEQIQNVDNEDFRNVLRAKYDDLCYKLCIHYTYGCEEMYMIELKEMLHEIEVYELGKKINLVF